MVDDPNIVSDHCIVQFSLLVSKNHIDAESAQQGNPLTYKYIWDNSQLEAYKIALESDEIKESFIELQSNITEAFPLDSKTANVNSFQVLIQSVCTPIVQKTINQSRNERVIKENSQPWCNDECKQKRNMFYKCLDMYRSDKNDVNLREKMVGARSENKRVLGKGDLIIGNRKHSSWRRAVLRTQKITGNF